MHLTVYLVMEEPIIGLLVERLTIYCVIVTRMGSDPSN